MNFIPYSLIKCQFYQIRRKDVWICFLCSEHSPETHGLLEGKPDWKDNIKNLFGYMLPVRYPVASISILVCPSQISFMNFYRNSFVWLNQILVQGLTLTGGLLTAFSHFPRKLMLFFYLAFHNLLSYWIFVNKYKAYKDSLSRSFSLNTVAVFVLFYVTIFVLLWLWHTKIQLTVIVSC